MSRDCFCFCVDDELDGMWKHRLDRLEALDDSFLAPGEVHDQRCAANAANCSEVQISHSNYQKAIFNFQFSHLDKAAN